MTSTDIALITVTALLFTMAVAVIVLLLAVKRVRAHKSAALFAFQFLFVAAIAMLSLALSVYYDLDAADVCGSVLIGIAAALAVLGVLILADIIPTKHKVPWLTGAVVLIVLFIQIAVNVKNPGDFAPDSTEPLTVGALIARVVSGTFQYFSLDAGYTEIIQIGARLPSGCAYVFYVLACSMTVIAPIIGGFAIFGALGHFFPKLVLWRSIKPTKYVFSELNEYSIETAESIAALKNKLAEDKAAREAYVLKYGKQGYAEIMRSVIIFTDVYADKSSEVDSELLQRASDINAICLKDDILTRKIYWICGALYRAVTHTQKKVVYFLMDKADFQSDKSAESNLQTAVSLLSTERSKMMWSKTHWWQFGMKTTDVEIYVFSQSANADGIIREAHDEWVKNYVLGLDKKRTAEEVELEKLLGGKKLSSADCPLDEAQKQRLKAYRISRYNKYLVKAQRALEAARKKRIIVVSDGVNKTDDNPKAHIVAYNTTPTMGFGAIRADLEKAVMDCADLYSAINAIDKILKIANANFSVLPSGVTYKTINEYQNLVYNLINAYADSGFAKTSYPLYSGLERTADGKYNTEKLNILVLGGGRIAKAFIKSAYWCGQMLNGNAATKLRIAVMSLDAPQSESMLKFEMPEAFDPNNCDYSVNPDSYCEFKFIPAQYGTAEFVKEFNDMATGRAWAADKTAFKHVNGRIDVDYVLVALGADNLNMQAADWIRRELGKLGTGGGKVIPINYVIENDALCSALAQDEQSQNCVLNPFGSLKDRFTFDNVCITDLERRALIADSTHGGGSGKQSFLLDNYARSSSIAAALHTPYKRVCIDFSADDYARHVYWLEHRRWNAYIRSTGFKCYTAHEFATLAVKTDRDGNKYINPKNKDLKLHICLLETSDTLTPTEQIRDFLAAHPDFFEHVFGVLGRIADGEAIKFKSGSKKREIVTLADLCEYIRATFNTALDNLDIAGALISTVKTGEDGTLQIKAANYKEYDIAITKQLQQEYLGNTINGVLGGAVIAAIAHARTALGLFTAEFDETDNRRCNNNDNVVCRRRNLFALLSQYGDYDILALRTPFGTVKSWIDSGGFGIVFDAASFDINRPMPNGFIVTDSQIDEAGKTCVLIGVPRGKTLSIIDGASNTFTVGVSDYQNYQKILNVSNPYDERC